MKTKNISILYLMVLIIRICIDVFMTKWVKRLVISITIILLFYIGFVNYTEPTEFGVARDHISGKMWIQESGGVYITPPWVGVACIDARPLRVAIMSTGRGYSAKLVQFDKKGWKEFVAIEGWRYYWWANRISFNLGYEEEYRGMKDIMRGYAYSKKQYPFIAILAEYQSK